MAKYTGKPFVKWVGGKTQLLPDLAARLPQDFNVWPSATYVEPFVGGGAMLFYMLQTYPNIRVAYINDINRKLITAYKVVKEQPQRLIALLSIMQKEYIPLDVIRRKDYYLRQREVFNSDTPDEITQAALLIFLNRTCFNGLYRVNAKGTFNVPHGRYSNPRICDEDTILADAALLQKVVITCGDFAQTLSYGSSHALFYLDPPYKPLSETSSFNSYSAECFDDSDQIRLCQYCKALEQQGGHFILSNSDVKGNDPNNNFFDNLYNSFSIRRVLATRMVNARPDKRGKLTELMVSNF